jgi:Tol biopolymer transport system component
MRADGHRRHRTQAGRLVALCLPLCALSVLLVSVPAARAAFPGKNGLIAFTRSKGGSFNDKHGDIWVMDPTAVKEIDITNTPLFYENQTTFAPDGRTLAYSWTDATDSGNGIGVIESNGAGARHLATAAAGETLTHPAWVADGRTILFQRTDANNMSSIWAVDAASGVQRQVTSGTSDSLPLGSPDGAGIAYLRNIPYPDPNAPRQEVIADANGTRPAGPYPADDWSPDGSRFVYSLNGALSGNTALHGIFTSAIDGSGQTQVADLPVQDVDPVFSPDGQWIVWTNEGSHDLWIVAAGGGQPRNLTHQTGFELNPSWGKYAPDTTPPAETVTGNRGQKLAKSLTISVGCDEICTAQASGTVRVRKPSKSYKLPSSKVAVPAGGTSKLSMGIPKKSRAALGTALKAQRNVQAKLKIVVTDIFGNAETVRRTVTLRR